MTIRGCDLEMVAVQEHLDITGHSDEIDLGSSRDSRLPMFWYTPRYGLPNTRVKELHAVSLP